MVRSDDRNLPDVPRATAFILFVTHYTHLTRSRKKAKNVTFSRFFLSSRMYHVHLSTAQRERGYYFLYWGSVFAVLSRGTIISLVRICHLFFSSHFSVELFLHWTPDGLCPLAVAGCSLFYLWISLQSFSTSRPEKSDKNDGDGSRNGQQYKRT